jgi:hypothetical protein
MVTTAHAIDRIAEVAGVLQATGVRCARALREADVNLWPQGSAGIGMAAQVEPQHLVNLVIGITASDTIAASAKTVKALGDMTLPSGRRYLKPEEIGPVGQVLFPNPKVADLPNSSPLLVSDTGLGNGRGLAVDLAWMVDLLAHANEKTLNTLKGSLLAVELILDPQHPCALIRYFEHDLKPPTSVKIFYMARQNLLDFPEKRDLPFLSPTDDPPIVRKVMLNLSLFTILSELWADTLAHRAAASAKRNRPKTRNADSPARESAHSQDQDRANDPRVATLENKVVEREFQPLMRGPGLSIKRIDQHASHSRRNGPENSASQVAR